MKQDPLIEAKILWYIVMIITIWLFVINIDTMLVAVQVYSNMQL